jgi:hypothetical protein
MAGRSLRVEMWKLQKDAGIKANLGAALHNPAAGLAY